MKILIVEDEFTSRVVMQKLLLPYGEAHVAVNGQEAVEVFARALTDNEPYDLVCLDIMMPEMDGLQVLKEIRRLEGENGIVGPYWVKIIMTTSVDEPKRILEAFNSQCEAYLIKPIERENFIEQLQKFDLVK